ncbi:hypothetical protein AUP68_09543 [Ilyonectria robusta]
MGQPRMVSKLLRLFQLLRIKRRPVFNGDEMLPRIPTEIILEIIFYLGRVDRAALALSSRQLLCVLGKNTLRLDQSARFRLLNRLERDGIRPMEILCPVCRIFHLPRLSNLASSKAEGARHCFQYGNKWIQRKSTSPHLPPWIYFDVIAAVTRSSRHQLACYEPDMVGKRIDDYGSKGVRIVTKYSVRVDDGRFLLKTETALYPMIERSQSLRRVSHL